MGPGLLKELVAICKKEEQSSIGLEFLFGIIFLVQILYPKQGHVSFQKLPYNLKKYFLLQTAVFTYHRRMGLSAGG